MILTPVIIAEIGWNFLGDLDLAKKMIKSAKDNGASYAKFQTWSVTRLKEGPWDTDGRREIYEKAELSKRDHLDLMEYCNEVGIEFMSSVFSLSDANLLKSIGCKYVKIPSFESRNHELISYCAENFDMVVMSTGTSTLDEIKESCKYLNRSSNWYLLHCVSSYPCNYSNGNLLKMQELRNITPNVGYSDHIQGVESAKIAIGEGAMIVEKHFTIDNDLPGRDNKFAILPADLNDLHRFIMNRELMFLGDPMSYSEVEQESRDIYTGRFDKK